MTNTFLTKRIFDATRCRPNQTLNNHIFKELFGFAASIKLNITILTND